VIGMCETDDLPPSAKFILKELRAAGHSLTTPQLADRTGLPDRTVRDAIARLRVEGFVETRHPSPKNPVAPRHRSIE
jgi:DNA-binding transcriptional regulator YhcF (GntR family)